MTFRRVLRTALLDVARRTPALRTLMSERRQLLRSVSELQGEVGSLQGQVGSLRDQVSSLEAALRELRDRPPRIPEGVALRDELDGLRYELHDTRDAQEGLTQRIDGVGHLIHSHMVLSEAARSKLDVAEQLLESLWRYRESEEYRRIYELPSPRVSVCIPTYNRARLLAERCLPSVLSQDYPDLEVVVVGDGCTDDTQEAVAGLGDPRVVFVNRPQREPYPIDPTARWMVAGAAAGNHALELATGDLITHIDDDDEYLPGRVRKLVAHLQQTRAELVHHPFYWETAPGRWEVNRSVSLQYEQVTTGAVLELAWFKRIPWDSKSYLYLEPGDWNRFRKLRYLGARIDRYPEPLLRHHREGNQPP